MGRFLRLLLVLGILATLGALGLWFVKPDLRPGWLPDGLPVWSEATTTLYRWQDESGQWVLSDKPPPAGVAFETVTYRNDANTLPGLDPET